MSQTQQNPPLLQRLPPPPPPGRHGMDSLELWMDVFQLGVSAWGLVVWGSASRFWRALAHFGRFRQEETHLSFSHPFDKIRHLPTICLVGLLVTRPTELLLCSTPLRKGHPMFYLFTHLVLPCIFRCLKLQNEGGSERYELIQIDLFSDCVVRKKVGKAVKKITVLGIVALVPTVRPGGQPQWKNEQNRPHTSTLQQARCFRLCSFFNSKASKKHLLEGLGR